MELHCNTSPLVSLHSRCYTVSRAMPFPSQPSPFALRYSKLTYRRNSQYIDSPSRKKIPNLTVCCSSQSQPSLTSKNDKLILVTSVVTLTLAVANRVLYKLALVPMKQYPFFLTQLNAFGYMVIYFSILYIRYRAGIVTDEMISIPKWRFLSIGVLEALGVATGMFAAAVLPGPAIPVLNQVHIFGVAADFSALILGRQYSFNQIIGCLIVATGVVVAVASGSNADQLVSGIEFQMPAIMILSSAFQAGATIIKESIFVDAAKRLKGKSLDIFVVNSFGSGFQALFVLLLLPFLSNLKGIPFQQLPSYLKSGAGCFPNIGAITPGCKGAPLLPLLYIATNLAFNISALTLLKSSSAVVASLAVMLSVPISVYVLSLPLPYLPEGASLSPFFLLGTAILVFGLVLYNVARPAEQIPK